MARIGILSFSRSAKSSLVDSSLMILMIKPSMRWSIMRFRQSAVDAAVESSFNNNDNNAAVPEVEDDLEARFKNL